MNTAMSYWKNMAILSHYPSFNLNNMIGDTYMSLIQAPEPLKFMSNYDVSLNYLKNELTNKTHTGYLKELHKFIVDEAVLDASFFQTELPRMLKPCYLCFISIKGNERRERP